MSSYAKHRGERRWSTIALSVSIGLATIHLAGAQNVPLISGGAGLITSTNGGITTYLPIIAPALVAPLGNHLLVESRASIVESYFPRGGGQSGYTHDAFLGLSKTCRKLGIAFWDYLGARLGIPGTPAVPYLPDLIRCRGQPA